MESRCSPALPKIKLVSLFRQHFSLTAIGAASSVPVRTFIHAIHFSLAQLNKRKPCCYSTNIQNKLSKVSVAQLFLSLRAAVQGLVPPHRGQYSSRAKSLHVLRREQDSLTECNSRGSRSIWLFIQTLVTRTLQLMPKPQSSTSKPHSFTLTPVNF